MIYCIYSLSSFTGQLCLILMSAFNRAPWSHGQFALHLEVRFTARSLGGELGYQYPLPFSISLQSTVFVLSLGSSQPVQTLGKVPLTDDEFIFCHWCLYWSYYQFTLCLHGQLALNRSESLPGDLCYQYLPPIPTLTTPTVLLYNLRLSQLVPSLGKVPHLCYHEPISK